MVTQNNQTLSLVVDNAPSRPAITPTSAEQFAAPDGLDNNDPMSDAVTRYELDAKLETIEAKIDARVAHIESMIGDIKDSNKATVSALSNLKTTTIATGISVALAIVFGVAAFNATLLSNMLSSFESGKNTATALTQSTEQLRQTQEQLKAIQERLDKQTTMTKAEIGKEAKP